MKVVFKLFLIVIDKEVGNVKYNLFIMRHFRENINSIVR